MMGSEWILGRMDGGWVDSVSSENIPVVSSCEDGDEPSVSGATESSYIGSIGMCL
jgi:hypothetical protein